MRRPSSLQVPDEGLHSRPERLKAGGLHVRRHSRVQVRLVVPTVVVVVSHDRHVRVRKHPIVLVVPEHDVRLDEVLEERVASRADPAAANHPRPALHVQRISEQIPVAADRPHRTYRPSRRALEPTVAGQPRQQPKLEYERAHRRHVRLVGLSGSHAVPEVDPRVRHPGFRVKSLEQPLTQIQRLGQEATLVIRHERRTHRVSHAAVYVERRRRRSRSPALAEPRWPFPRGALPGSSPVAERDDVRREQSREDSYVTLERVDPYIDVEVQVTLHPSHVARKLGPVAQHGERRGGVNERQRHTLVVLRQVLHVEVAELAEGIGPRAAQGFELIVWKSVGHVVVVRMVEHGANIRGRARSSGSVILPRRHPIGGRGRRSHQELDVRARAYFFAGRWEERHLGFHRGYDDRPHHTHRNPGSDQGRSHERAHQFCSHHEARFPPGPHSFPGRHGRGLTGFSPT